MKSTIPDWMEKEVAEYDIDLVEPPRTILDIGANIGAYTLRCLDKWPHAKVTAYEPIQGNVAAFIANVGLDRPHQVILFPAALRGFSGMADITLGDMGVTCGFHNLGRSTTKTETVSCMTAEGTKPADLVKIDTEGCELEIVRGLDLSKTTALVCEYHLGDWKEIKAVVEAAGLPMFKRSPSSLTHGVMKFSRPGTVNPPPGVMVNPIPDSAPVKVKLADGREMETIAAAIRYPFFRPSLAGKKLFIGLPINREMPTLFAEMLLALQAQKPLPIEVHIAQGDGVARSRNNLTSQFLASDCTHILMIDCDLVFSADHIVHMLERDVPLVGGFYPKKQEGPLEWVINTLPGTPPCRRDGMQPLKYIGTGFIMIAREVFEKMAAAHPELEFVEDYGSGAKAHDFWSMGVYRDKATGVGRYLSEDWYFCQRWLDLGGEVWGDANVTLQHWGPAIYPLLTQRPEMAQPVQRDVASPSSGVAA